MCFGVLKVYMDTCPIGEHKRSIGKLSQSEYMCFYSCIRNRYRGQAKVAGPVEKSILYKYMQLFPPNPSCSYYNGTCVTNLMISASHSIIN